MRGYTGHGSWACRTETREVSVQGTSKLWGSEEPLEYSAEPCSMHLRDETTREKTPKGWGNDSQSSQGGETVPATSDQEKNSSFSGSWVEHPGGSCSIVEQNEP